jgi:glycosyltransferase involved in cell wall biosynthesis
VPQNLIYIVTDTTVANKFGLEQINYLSKNNFDIHLICGEGSLDLEMGNVCKTVTQIKSLHRSIKIFDDLKTLFIIFNTIHSIKPICMVYSTPKASLLGAILSYFLRIDNRIYQIWGARWETLSGFSLFIVKLMDKITIKLSTSVIGVSDSISNLYKSITKKEILVLGRGSAVGVDSNIFSIQRVHTQCFKLGYAGRIAQDKGISDLLLIYRMLKKFNSQITLDIIGDVDVSDPVDSSVMKYIQSDSGINWVRHCSRFELANHMKNWTLQILLSQREGLGNVIIEAGACGIPTVCWDVTGVRDAIPDYLKENLIQNKRIDLIYLRIKEYIENPFTESEASELSSWTIQNFDKKIVLNNFVNHVKNEIFSERDRSYK